VVKRTSLVLGLVAIAGCASIIDINRLDPPPAGASADGGDGGSEGGCSATGVTTLTLSPRGVHTVLDDKDVYFTRADPPRDSAILRCSKCGCDKPTELAKLNQPGGIAVDDTYVFWTDSHESGSLNRIDKNDPTHLQQVINQESPIGVTMDADFVYWTVIGGGPKGVTTAGVYRARKSDLGEVTLLTRSDQLPSNIVPYAIAVDDTYVYYTTAPDLNDQDAQEPCHADVTGAVYGTVRRVKKAGPALQTSDVLASKQACPLGLALDTGAIYWSNLGAGKTLAGSVWSMTKTGASQVRLASELGRPTSLAFFGDRLAWNVPASQRVESCATPACGDLASLATDQRNPSGVSADATGIYWAALGSVAENFSDGAVRRASPP
jgi:hypothetical protein